MKKIVPKMNQTYSSNRTIIESTKSSWYVSKVINQRRFNVICSSEFKSAFIHKIENQLLCLTKRYFILNLNKSKDSSSWSIFQVKEFIKNLNDVAISNYLQYKSIEIREAINNEKILTLFDNQLKIQSSNQSDDQRLKNSFRNNTHRLLSNIEEEFYHHKSKWEYTIQQKKYFLNEIEKG